jgi:hypothetical protein
MRKAISKAIYVKNLVVWTLISVVCLISFGVYMTEFVKGLGSEEEIFWPGVSILGVLILAVTFFAVTRVVKYVRRVREG